MTTRQEMEAHRCMVRQYSQLRVLAMQMCGAVGESLTIEVKRADGTTLATFEPICWLDGFSS